MVVRPACRTRTRKSEPCSETVKDVNRKGPLEATDPINRVVRHEQTTIIFGLRTGYCSLRAHLNRIGTMHYVIAMKQNGRSTTSSRTDPSRGNRDTRGRYQRGRRPSSDDSLHGPTVIPPSALDKPSVMKRYHRRRTTR